MLATLALIVYAVLCLAICAGIALFVAYPARGRDLPGRLRKLSTGSARPGASRRTSQRRRAQGDEMPQRG